MRQFQQGDAVQVVALHGDPHAHLSEGFATRPPMVGDVGVVVSLLPTGAPPSPTTRYLVEGGQRGAAWAWLAEFVPAELQPTEPPL